MRFAVDHGPQDHLGLREIATDRDCTTEIALSFMIECRVKQLIVITPRTTLVIVFGQGTTDTNYVTRTNVFASTS